MLLGMGVTVHVTIMSRDNGTGSMKVTTIL